MITEFNIENLRDSKKKLSLHLESNVSEIVMGRLKGKTSLGKSIANGVQGFSLDNFISGQNKNRNDDEIAKDDGVIITYKGELGEDKFSYSVSIIDSSKVKSESFTVNDAVVFEKTPSRLSDFSINLKGAESLKTHLGDNRTVKLLNYVCNNSIYDLDSTPGKVLDHFYKIVENTIYISPDISIYKGSEYSTFQFIKLMVSERNYPNITSESLNKKLLELFCKTNLDESLRFKVKISNDFEGRSLQVIHENETFLIQDSTQYFFKLLILNAILSVNEHNASIIFQDDALKEISGVADFSTCLSNIYSSNTQIILT